jgi:hypothetical protein
VSVASPGIFSVGSTNSVENGREKGDAGMVPLLRGSAQFANELYLYYSFVTDVFSIEQWIRLCQKLKISEGLNPPNALRTPQPSVQCVIVATGSAAKSSFLRTGCRGEAQGLLEPRVVPLQCISKSDFVIRRRFGASHRGREVTSDPGVVWL